MVIAQVGMVLLVPAGIGVAVLVALVAAVRMQVRAVKEPYLRRVHGDAYAAQPGRFVSDLRDLSYR